MRATPTPPLTGIDLFMAWWNMTRDVREFGPDDGPKLRWSNVYHDIAGDTFHFCANRVMPDGTFEIWTGTLPSAGIVADDSLMNVKATAHRARSCLRREQVLGRDGHPLRTKAERFHPYDKPSDWHAVPAKGKRNSPDPVFRDGVAQTLYARRLAVLEQEWAAEDAERKRLRAERRAFQEAHPRGRGRPAMTDVEKSERAAARAQVQYVDQDELAESVA